MTTTSAKPLYDAPRVGGDILFRCTRCKMELAHVIISMSDNVPAKLQCKTCKSERKYRRTSGKTTKTGKSRTPRLNTGALWDEKIAASKKDMVAYSPRASFVAGDVLKHPVFGVGIVEESRGTGKILVLFREGERILVHGLA